MDEAEQETVELVVAGGDATETLEPVAEPLDDVALFAALLVVVLELTAVGHRRDDRLPAQRSGSAPQPVV